MQLQLLGTSDDCDKRYKIKIRVNGPIQLSIHLYIYTMSLFVYFTVGMYVWRNSV